VIIWLILAAMADFILFALGLVLSFAINKPLRPAVRIATVLLGIPLIPTGYFIAVPDALIPLAWNAPRNLTELDNGFPSKRADLETLLRMSGEDREFSEIAPDFVNRNAGVSGKSTKYERPDPQIALPRARWDQYRSLFAHNGIKLGLMRSLNGDVLIEIDTDGHRSGIQPDDALLLDVARVLCAGKLQLGGVLTHAGSSYECDTPAGLQAIAEQERSGCVHAAGRLRAAGFPCPEVSVGSTPSALTATHLDAVTEVRAGVYVFFDLVMCNIGVCKTDDIALSVLTTVIGHQGTTGSAIVDAGWMAMSADRGTSRQRRDYAYGQVCALDGAVLPGCLLGAVNQEHGILSVDDAHDGRGGKRFPVGTRLRILPNHACATGAQFPRYHVLAEDGRVDTWDRVHGW